ncbi:hypothetical protein NKDENANG_00592 [Candidatus Entotheonellaceae bacterium PAL068K]
MPECLFLLLLQVGVISGKITPGQSALFGNRRAATQSTYQERRYTLSGVYSVPSRQAFTHTLVGWRADSEVTGTGVALARSPWLIRSIARNAEINPAPKLISQAVA